MEPPLANRAILVAAPPSLHRTGLISTIQETWPTYPLRITAETSQLPLLVRQHSHALLILDCYRTKETCLLLAQLRQVNLTLPILALCGPHLVTALNQQFGHLGVTAHLPYTCSPVVVREVIGMLLLGSHGGLSHTSTPAKRKQPFTQFTPRELEILRLVIADMDNLAIASHLCLSVRTVESHRRALLQKAGTKTVIGLVAQAITQGWVGSELCTAGASA